jgi:cytochrome c oxidase subunit 4
MDNNHSKHEEHVTPYGMYILVWLGLLALTSITVTIAGIDLGTYTLLVALSIAAVKSALVINIFMHIKFDEPIFKIFLLISGLTLVIILVLTFFDYSFR